MENPPERPTKCISIMLICEYRYKVRCGVTSVLMVLLLVVVVVAVVEVVMVLVV
jgi:hypothetical protein